MKAILSSQSKLVFLALILLLIVSFIAALPVISPALKSILASGTEYYVDSVNGNDENSGKSPESAWKTLNRVNSHGPFKPGDKILLAAGSVWNGEELAPQGSGTAEHPIIIDRYGEGESPLINRNGTFNPPHDISSSAIRLNNQSYWIIRNIAISNINAENPGELEPLQVIDGVTYWPGRAGILVVGDISEGKSTTVKGIHIINVTINGIDTTGGDDCNYYYQKNPGAQGWAVSSGAILFSCMDNSAGPYSDAPTVMSTMDDILVQNCTIRNAGGNNISLWSNNRKLPDRFINVRIIGNNIFHDDTCKLSGNAIYVFTAKDTLVEGNRIHNITNGVTFQNSDGALVQYNTVTNMDGLLYDNETHYDGVAFDTDLDCVGTFIYQYNYTSACYEAAYLIEKGYSPCENIIRYNISYGDAAVTFCGYDGDPAKYTVKVYNNTVIRLLSDQYASIPGTGSRLSMINQVPRAEFYNNIFYYPGQSLLIDFVGAKYVNNLFYGNLTNKNIGENILKDPGFASGSIPENARELNNMSYDGSIPGTGSLLEAGFFKLAKNSPCIDKAVDADAKGYKLFEDDKFHNDFYGKEHAGKPDLGACEHTE